MSIDHATRVQECAAALKTAVAEAKAAGYRVDGVGNLDGIGVSETAKVAAPAVAATPPALPKASRASAPTPPKE